MLYPVGFSEADFKKPQIGIASTWSRVTPCNMHINELAEMAAKGADQSGAKSVLFNTITVSDGISMGTPGMRYSLVSREVIADSIETVVGAQGFDGFVAIGGCDKNMPACAIAMARLDRPSVFVYGGTIQTGTNRRDIVSVFEAVGAHAEGSLSDIELKEIEQTAIPGPGSCAGMYTANTMASAIEALGLSLPNSSAQEAVSEQKRQDSFDAGAAVSLLIDRGIKPSDILSREAFENAIAITIALEGSTNAVLPLLAIAHASKMASRPRHIASSASKGGAPPGPSPRSWHFSISWSSRFGWHWAMSMSSSVWPNSAARARAHMGVALIVALSAT